MSDFKTYVELLKEAIRIEDVIGERFPLRGNGRYLRATEHDSLVVDTDKQYFSWNSRGLAGDVFNWLEAMDGLEFKEAVRRMGDRAGMQFEWSAAETQRFQARRARYDALGLIAAFMADKLWTTAEPLAYAQGRGWTDETIRAARLGYWHWDYAQELRDHLQVHGVALDRPEVVAVLGFQGDVSAWAEKWEIAPKGLDKKWVKSGKVPVMPKEMLVYPHLWQGKVAYMAGRKLDWTPDSPYGKSWNLRAAFVGGRQPYWNHVWDRRAELLVVVEGQADAVTLAQWEIPAVALAGTRATADLVETLRRQPRVFVALDSDQAGETGARHLAEELGPGTPVVQWPGNGDANDWLQDGGNVEDCHTLLEDAPIYALWRARRWDLEPPLKRGPAKRRVFELIGSLQPYDRATNMSELVKAMGCKNSPELNNIVKSIKSERIEEPKKKQPKPLPDVNDGYPELPEAMKHLFLTASEDHSGHAKCVKALFGKHVAFVPEWGWLFNDGKYWSRIGGKHRVKDLVAMTLKMRRLLAVEHKNETLVRATSGSNWNEKNTQEVLERMVLTTTGDFDQNPDLLNCDNGVVNLRNGDLIPHDSLKHRFTYCLPTAYKPGLEPSEWLRFLGDAIGSEDKYGIRHVDMELMDWLQMAVGYSLTGHSREGCLFYLYGPTRSGKGTFTQTIQRLLGKPLSAGIDFNILVQKREKDPQNFALAPLKPCRVLVGSEPGKYERFNEAKMKLLTGEDTVRCSFKQKDHFEYEPQFKIWLSSNWMFNADTSDAAAWGRARIIRFPNSFLGREDKGLKKRLQTNESLEGILSWAVRGAINWYKSELGLVTPRTVTEEVNEQRNQQDFVQQFLDDCFDLEETAFTPFADIYKAYKNWCDGMITHQQTRSFSQTLSAKGYVSKRKHVKLKEPSMNFDEGTAVTSKRVRGFYGLKLNGYGMELIQKVQKNR